MSPLFLNLKNDIFVWLTQAALSAETWAQELHLVRPNSMRID